MAYIKDLSYSDGGMSYYADVPAGHSFSKGWRIQNTGTCTWNAYYYIAFVSGTQMSGQSTSIQKYVYPGQTYDVYVSSAATRRSARPYRMMSELSEGQSSVPTCRWCRVGGAAGR